MVHDDVLTGLRNAGNGDNGTAAEGTHQNEAEQRRKTMGKAQARWKREENRKLPFRSVDIEVLGILRGCRQIELTLSR